MSLGQKLNGGFDIIHILLKGIALNFSPFFEEKCQLNSEKEMQTHVLHVSGSLRKKPFKGKQHRKF